MAHCTGCGSHMQEQFAFCPQCGTPAVHQEPGPVVEPHSSIDQARMEPDASAESHVPVARPATDRKTLFADGMLVLTHEDLILYSPDELDELMRIPVAKIASCSRGMMRHSLVVKILTNVEENFARHLNDIQKDMGKTYTKIEKQRKQLAKTSSAKEKRSINIKISDLENKYRQKAEYMQRLHTDPEEIRDTKRREADIKKETFHLPKGYLANDSEEYTIWVYAVRRRMAGPSVLRVESSPPEAIVLVDGVVEGNTPMTLDMPLTETAALSGKHEVQVLLEGHESKTLRVKAAPGTTPKVHKIRLDVRRVRSPELDDVIAEYRQKLPDRTVYLQEHDIEMEVAGTEGVMVLVQDRILLLSKDRTRWLTDIPYQSMIDAKLDKKIMGRVRGIVLSYRDKSLGELECRFEAQAVQDEGQTVRRRCENIVKKLHLRMTESYTQQPPPRTHPHSYKDYDLSESDIADGFARFDAYGFEVLVARLFTSKGYETKVTQGSGDMGVDVVARNSDETIVIQVKKWNANVGGPDVHKTLGSMVSHRANRALVVTTSDFTKQAYEIRDGGSPVELWNGRRLVNEFRAHLV